MKTTEKIHLLLFTAVFLFFVPNAISAQTAADILNQMLVKHSNSLDPVETMMTIVKMDGFLAADEPDTIYYRKMIFDDGTATLEPVNSSTQSMGSYYENFKKNYDTLVENSVYEGTETVNNVRAHVIFIENVAAFYGSAMGDAQQEQAEPQSGWFYIDADELVPVKMKFNLQFDEGYEGSVDINLSDYRSISGVPMAFQTDMVIEGISEQVSAEDMAEAKNSIQELRAQLDNASGLQKNIMERVVAPQLERLEKILEDGNMSMNITILEAAANVEIPDNM